MEDIDATAEMEVNEQNDGEGGFLRRRKSGLVLHRHTRYQVKEVSDRLHTENSEKGLGKSMRDIVKEVCESFGICRRTYFKIMNEHQHANETGSMVSTPGRKRPHAKRCVDGLDNFMQDAIRRHIHGIYLKREYPNLSKLLSYARNELGYTGKRTSLSLALKKMGFRYKVYDGRKYLLEQHHVQLLRAEYLRKWRQYTSEGRPMVYLDETWIWQNTTPNTVWQQPDIMPIYKKSGKGKHIILLHAGSKEGFVPNACLLFASNTGAADYHKDMNGQVFKDWFLIKLLPNIPQNSVIVMDNAPYHSMQTEKTPTSGSRKAEILEWLHAHEIMEANNTMSKAQLYELVRQNKPHHKSYLLDQLASAAGHDVLRLPPYHCKLNPIELIWANVKPNVAKQNTTFKLKDVMDLTTKCVNEVTQQLWRSCIEHTDKLAIEYLQNEPLLDEHVEELVINPEADSSSDSDTDAE